MRDAKSELTPYPTETDPMNPEKDKKKGKIKELFVQDLARIQGGQGGP